jgi:argininosuccinate lyase
VRETADAGKTLEDLTAADLRRHSPSFAADSVAILSAEKSLARRSIEGGPAPSAVKRRLTELGRK